MCICYIIIHTYMYIYLFKKIISNNSIQIHLTSNICYILYFIHVSIQTVQISYVALLWTNKNWQLMEKLNDTKRLVSNFYLTPPDPNGKMEVGSKLEIGTIPTS